MSAYQYVFVKAYPSFSDASTIYSVCVRLDNRILDPAERIKRAMLSCNCRGWTFLRVPGGSDTDRTCKHTKAEAGTLVRFKANGGRLTAPPAATSTASGAPAVAQPVPGMIFDQPLPTKRSQWAGLLVAKTTDETAA
jgi:hypothetical protein